jgi:hypothetical protein
MASGGITIDQAVDLGIATLQAFDQDAVQIALKHPTYEVINRWFGDDKKVMAGGKKATWDLTVKDTGNAGHVNMFETDTPNIANVNVEGEVNWCHAKNSFTYSVDELAMNLNDKTRIFNLFKNRRQNCAREFADLLEEAAWKTPSSSTDTKAPFGIPGWLCQADTSVVTGDFAGYVGDYSVAVLSTESAMATVGGLACTTVTNTRWANWYANHSDQLNDSLLDKLGEAFRKTKFMTPKIAGQAIDPESGFNNFRLYTNNEVLKNVEAYARKSDDRLGGDLGKYAGNTVFKGVPMIYVDSLDNTMIYVYGKNPIFGVNHNHFYPMVLSGKNFIWSKPINDVAQHLVLTVYLDLTYAYVCDNRRSGGFLLSNWENAY